MSQAQKIPFLNLFSAWRPGEELAALAGGYLVTVSYTHLTLPTTPYV